MKRQFQGLQKRRAGDDMKEYLATLTAAEKAHLYARIAAMPAGVKVTERDARAIIANMPK